MIWARNTTRNTAQEKVAQKAWERFNRPTFFSAYWPKPVNPCAPSRSLEMSELEIMSEKRNLMNRELQISMEQGDLVMVEYHQQSIDEIDFHIDAYLDSREP